jgi:glutathione reductase (NADPH)
LAEYDYDLFVIGAGSGGVRAARIAAGYGAKVAIAEEYRVGGTCVIRGCVPKKLLVYASRFAEEFEDAAGYGWTVGESHFDWSALIAAKDREIERLSGIYAANLDRAGVEILRTRAELRSAHEIALTGLGRTVTAKYVLVGTGARPFIPSIPGCEHAISSNEAFQLEKLPERVAVIGGGYIAVEFANIFHGLGARTTLVYRGDKILRGFDDDLRTALTDEMRVKGIDIRTSCEVGSISPSDGGYTLDLKGEMIEVDRVMYATGRVPNIKGLGLDAAGVHTDDLGAIQVDAFSRTNVENIYAVGDVTNRLNLTPVAIREGHAFADTVFGGRPTSVDHSLVPTAVFSQPEIGTVGLTEAEALARYPEVDIYRTSFRLMKHTMTGRQTRTLMKLVVDARDDRVLGVHLLGEGMGELIQIVGVAVRMGARKMDFDRTVAVHPTAAEELVTLREPTARHRRAAAE